MDQDSEEKLPFWSSKERFSEGAGRARRTGAANHPVNARLATASASVVMGMRIGVLMGFGWLVGW